MKLSDYRNKGEPMYFRCPCCDKPLKHTQKQVIVHSSCQRRMLKAD